MEKYEVVSVIGEGSFGRVYKAKVLNSDKFVALKLIVKVSTYPIYPNQGS